jgi:hypothetical protein
MSANPTCPGSLTATTPATPTLSPSHPSPFLERIIRFLMPYFYDLAPEPAAARREVLETLASYGGRSRSEIINAARIIAFSFSALDILAEAQGADMSALMRLRHRGCANGLNRSCQQNEQILAKRLARDLPTEPKSTAEPANDMPEPMLEDAIQTAEAQIAAYRKRPAGPAPIHPASHLSPRLPSRTVSAAEQEKNKRMWGNAMVNVLAELGMPVQPIATG